LIFDEVITGFRFCYGGYQDLVGLKPDLTCLGKIIGGGLPVGAFGGRSEIMDLLAPEGPVYQAGTLAGNPLAMAAGLATLNVLKDEDPYGLLGKRLGWLASEVEAEGRRLGLPLTFRHLGSMGGLFFAEGPLDNLSQVRQADAARYAAFFHALLEQGVYLAPSAFEAFFIGTAHSDAVLEETLAAMHKALAAL
jgi:glutamate-1-semialdehyde 2,1-aminomutase